MRALIRRVTTAAVALVLLLPPAIVAQQKAVPPDEYLPGKDVVWVPSPPAMVEQMLDLAKVTPQDFVVDLGSGDGRNIIAAARRGVRALGVEFNPDLVELSRTRAREAGVDGRATFTQGDMYEADFSQASVLVLFLLPSNLDKLKDKFLALKPGARIALNTFGVAGWTPDATAHLAGCEEWCDALLYIVPARVAGRWTMAGTTLTFTQEYQMVTGTLAGGGSVTPITAGRLRGDEITFTAGERTYTGRVAGDRIEGAGWVATRVK
jgi:SAM-dependent methyltransferase